ncbi:hypothetical protein Prudu_013557 [Prunus dulcis]|uniref:Uncharacterized protein n=1 Tax=Prunus dulcis TaxID=3755 RepID=A0A4Y1RFY7_PRUDU|nr:hypothetical protein Prudu_013557 [Prunus dulcis]
MTVCPFAFQATARPPQAKPISAVGTYGSAFVSPSQPDQPPPGTALSWPENRVFRRRFVRSYPNFQLEILLVSPPNRSSKVSEVQPIRRRNLQRAVEVRGIHHRAIHSFRVSKPAILGITNTLSLALQKKDQDIVSAMNLVKTCKENLQLMRDNEFEELVEQASSFCYKHDIIVPTMDEEYVIPGRSRRNAPMKTNYHRYNFYTKPPWLHNPGSATDDNILIICWLASSHG